MTPNSNSNSFPFWHFLNQPLFDAHYPAILNPRRFWRCYKIQHLERCWVRAYRPEEHFRN